MNNEILYLKINDIFPNPLHENKYNLYDLISLSDSLKNDDFTEPLKVIKLIFADHNKYFIYDNNLLYSASVCADISYIPCIVINTDTFDDSINYLILSEALRFCAGKTCLKSAFRNAFRSREYLLVLQSS